MQDLPRITEDDIAQFLLSTPDFFERHAELLASVQLTCPHAGRAISLPERQAELLREKIRHLELKVADMIRHSQENAQIADKLHGWTEALVAHADARELPSALTNSLQRDFAVPQVALRLWGLHSEWADLPEAVATSTDAQAFVASLGAPYCGPNPGLEAVQWLPEPALVQSMALLPLRRAAAARPFGLLLLASHDPQRFHAGMGTDFLQRIGALSAAALSRLLPHN
jgi:uncharacterized protein YigA (DUF484 family)